MSTGVASPPSHPPLPKKPSLAPKPRGLVGSSPARNTVIEGDSVESVSSSSSTDTITNETSLVPPDVEPNILDTSITEPSTPEVGKPNGSPARPTPKPRKTTNYKANGAPEVAPSPKPRVPPKKRNIPSQDQDQISLAESSSTSSSPSSTLSSSSSLPNGNDCEVITNGSAPSPRERPSAPVRRLTIGSSDLTPKVSPRTSPKWSPVRPPLQRSASSTSSTSNYSVSSDIIADDTESSSLEATNNDKNNFEVKSDHRDVITSVPTSRPKPIISPKKPSLAMLSKRKTVCAVGNVSLDNCEKSSPESGKKAVPQRPSVPPKRLSGIQVSSPKPPLKSKPVVEPSIVTSTDDPPHVNGNKFKELSDIVPCRVDPSSTNSSATNDICDNTSTVKLNNSEPTNASSSGTEPKPIEDSKAPQILPRKAVLRNPVAPPRRVKSMSESDPNSELNSENMQRNGNSTSDTSGHEELFEKKNPDRGEERTNTKTGEALSGDNTERSTLKRNRRAVKSYDPLAFDSIKSAKDMQKGSNGEVKEKAKPPRPPPPSRPSGLPHQTSLQGQPPRPKPKRAKTFDFPSQSKDKLKVESGRGSRQNSPIRGKPIQVTDDSSDWEIIDITPQEKQSIDETGRDKKITSESVEAEASCKPKNDEETESKLPINVTASTTSSDKQSGTMESKTEEVPVTKESESETEKQVEGGAVSQLKLRKKQPPVPAQRNSIEGSPVHRPSVVPVLEERDLDSGDRSSQEINGRPVSQGSLQGSPINGRSPNSSPKKTLKDRGRGTSPKRPSCPPPPPPGGLQPRAASPRAPSPSSNVPTPRAPSPSSKVPLQQPESPVPADVPSAPKPKRPAPPRPMAPPVKPSSGSRSNSPKRIPPSQTVDVAEDEANIYTDADAHLKNKEADEDSDESSRDHDYELIPDPRRTLPRNTDPPSSNDDDAGRDNAIRASGYIDDGLYLEPNAREPEDEDEEKYDNEYVYPEFMPANTIPPAPPTPPPIPELDQVFTPDSSPAEPKSRRSSVPRRKAPQKPKRTRSIQSDASLDSHSYYDMSGGVEGLERAHRSPSDRSGSLTDSSGNEEEDASLSDDEYDDDGSYAGVSDLQEGEDGSLEDFDVPEARKRLQSLGRKAQKAFLVAKEIKDSEKVFVDVLTLLNVDLRKVIDEGSKKNGGRAVIERATLDQILGHLPQLQLFNENLLMDLESRIRNWSKSPKIADIFVTKGQFLKLYTVYIQNFEQITAAFDEACNKNPIFMQVVKEFEMSERCRSLAIKHYMLKPVQRIPQYKLLLTDYQKQLDAQSEEYSKTTEALSIVSEVANHANESMRQGDNFEKLLAIQHSLIGNQEIVKPGRRFIKEGELLKMSRRVNQPRKFFLLSDILLHTTPFPPGQFKLNNELSLAGMKVNRSSQEESNELEIISVQRSFTLLASSQEDCEAWYNALTKTINEYENKKNTLLKPEEMSVGDTSSLGRKAPLWIPDCRVTMCMICTSEFTITWRRHHCRACGKVTCGYCSKNKVPLMYLAHKEPKSRVCDSCYETLVGPQQNDGLKEKKEKQKNKTKRKKSNRVPNRSSALKVSAKDPSNSSMSGYLWQRVKKKEWKRMWYSIKDKVLFTFKASEDVVALTSTPLLGYAVCVINEPFEGFDAGLILQLTQGRMKHILRSETPEACARWNEAMLDASCLD